MQDSKTTPEQKFKDALRSEYERNWTFYNDELRKKMADDMIRQNLKPILRALQNSGLVIAYSASVDLDAGKICHACYQPHSNKRCPAL